MREFCLVCRNNRCSRCRRIGGFHHPQCSRPDPSRRCRACGGPVEKRPGARYCDACRARRCPTCRQIGFHVGQHRIGPHRVEPERLDLVSTAELEAVILGAYALAHDRARALVGEQDALDAAHNAIVDVLARRAFLPRVSPWYIVRASVTSALMQLRRDDRLIPVEDPEGIRSRDDSLSDLCQQSGSPEQWLAAWNVVAEREQAERIRAERAAERAKPLRTTIGGDCTE